MSSVAEHEARLRVWGRELHGIVLCRDGGHLSPKRMTRVAAARLRSGIAAVEAWLRRVLLRLALALEPDLTPRQTPYNPRVRPKRLAPRALRLAGFRPDRPLTRVDRHALDLLGEACRRDRPYQAARREGGRREGVPVGHLLDRLAALAELIEAPMPRARRLAFHLARRRPGWLMAPGRRRERRAGGGLRSKVMPWQYGTVLSSVYDALAVGIVEASRARPPPIGPRPRVGPRIRQL